MSKIVFVTFIFVSILLASCDFNHNLDNAEKRHNITIAGSTSVMPFVEKLSEHYMVDKPSIIINVQGGGSTAGIQASLNKTIDIGMSSRELKEEEKSLNEILVCYDGISIVVHPKNPMRDISLSQVRGIFSGKIKNWKDLGWIDRRIDAITREEGSGTRGAFEELVMKKEEIDDGIMVQDSNGSVKEIVATDPYAIGYISLGLVDARVKGLSIDGISANIENIKKKRYKLIRPFLFLTNGIPNDYVQHFIDFVLSNHGQDILKKEGLIGK